MDHKIDLPVSNERWEQLKNVSASDDVMQNLRGQIRSGWSHKVLVVQHLRPYFDVKDQLVVQGDLVFRGQKVLVPQSFRKELMEEAHASHAGI